jgi:hypothetical protein
MSKDHLRIVGDAERSVAQWEQEKSQVIAHLRELSAQMRDMTRHYESVMRSAARYKISNTELARAMGKTEGAVRMYKKRRGIK